MPFKYDKLLTNHTNFVRDVGFAPNGDLFASVGSDGKLYLYDGKTGELKTEASVESKRSLMALSWSPDSTRIATAGADGIVAIWDAATAKIAQSYTIGSDVVDQQNGVVYANKDSVVSVSLSGDLNVFDLRESGDKWRKLYGPTKAITAALGVGKGDNQTFYTGAFNGTMNAFAIGSSYGDREGECTPVAGTGHTGRIVGLASNSKDKVFTTAWDDKVSSIVGGSFSSTSVPMKAQPTAIAATPTATYVSSPEGIEILPADGSPATLHPGAATAVAAHASADGDLVAFGAGPTKLVLGKAKGGQIAVLAEFDRNAGDVLALAFSPDGSLLASGDSKGRIVLVDVKSHEVLVGMKWIVHTGRIAQLEFSPSGRRIVSGANDEGIVVTDIDNIMGYVTIRNTHPGGVSGVHWESDTKIISSGADACVRTWEVPIKKKA